MLVKGATGREHQLREEILKYIDLIYVPTLYNRNDGLRVISIQAWISNYIQHKAWDEITYSFPKFNGCTVEVWEWISNFISHFAWQVITYPSWDYKWTILAKGALAVNNTPKIYVHGWRSVDFLFALHPVDPSVVYIYVHNISICVFKKILQSCSLWHWSFNDSSHLMLLELFVKLRG